MALLSPSKRWLCQKKSGGVRPLQVQQRSLLKAQHGGAHVIQSFPDLTKGSALVQENDNIAAGVSDDLTHPISNARLAADLFFPPTMTDDRAAAGKSAQSKHHHYQMQSNLKPGWPSTCNSGNNHGNWNNSMVSKWTQLRHILVVFTLSFSVFKP